MQDDIEDDEQLSSAACAELAPMMVDLLKSPFEE